MADDRTAPRVTLTFTDPRALGLLSDILHHATGLSADQHDRRMVLTRQVCEAQDRLHQKRRSPEADRG